MKYTKMSLVAALLVGSSAFAIDNTKISGDAKLFYDTSDTLTNELTDQASSRGQAAIDLAITTDLTESVSAGVSTTALTTLGLENNLVGAVWSDAAATPDTSTDWWVSEAWMATTMGKTTAKIGRQALDTPLAFSETWTIAQNTFDAAVLVNQDIKNTTLVGAYIGNGNGASDGTVVNVPTDAKDDSYATFGVKGAYAAGVINNSVEDLALQAWFYDVTDMAQAFWLQGDFNMDGIMVGAQYSTMLTEGQLAGQADSNAFAAKLGYSDADMGLTASVAYSQTAETGFLNIGNVATGANVGAQSKLYTEAWWNYGYVGAADMTAMNVTVEYALQDIADLGLYYTDITAGDKAANKDVNEITLSASRSYGALDTSLVYIRTDNKNINNTNAFNTVQVYLTLNY
ncbi:hypothetical protein GJV85_11145 [Sulfurimonas aquatica]|uniref:Porin n=1 Tax=Sulfurimonas aquatica TaxID=2672570 RepID=A0A975B1X5_9BACT|nr:hypothetical protein [Sulfurimonas aquatica]QSZ42640.1 hypothetical protein GJV85_11145 [Sulfurimonas aquatica]